ncbi:hypothetical protein cypCar_00042723 [Cyprinus carpio]|nr:hypothetical protein cypCar_00042723 [Cyprinus carpio]
MWVQILELNENGEYMPVEVVPARDVRTGGIFQLKQGQSRRIQVEVRSVQDSGTMPLIAEIILGVSIGCVEIRQVRMAKNNEPEELEGDEMDSYQERDLERLRRQCLTALTKRQEYLDQHLQTLVSKADKSEDDVEREAQLLEWRLTLTEERNAVMVPSAGSGIPGAPAEWVPVPGMETHIPVLFLDLSAYDFSSQDNLDVPEAGGWDAMLSSEDEDEFFDLQIVKHYDGEVKAEASWDSTVHECPQLSRGAAPDQRVYLIVRTVVQLSHPAEMQLVLRKRICVNLTGRQGFAHNFLRRMSTRSTIPGCGVTFEVVSNIPGQDSQSSEDREMLARVAASAENPKSSDNEAAIEKYLRSVLAVENILTLDRLRQEVAVKEHLAGKGKGSRRSLSSPSVHRLSGSRQDLSLNSVLDDNKNRWESQQDIFATSSQFSKTLPRPSRPPTPPTQNQDPEQVKALVPQMPKLLKSLFPVRDDKKDLRPSPHSQQHMPRIMMQNANNPDEGRVRIEPAAVMGKSPASDRHSDGPDAPSSVHDPHDLPLSPISESSSGYFSTSVSTATLSDVSIACGDLTPTPNSQAGPVASRHDKEDCLPTPVNASVAPVEAGLRSDRPRKEEDTQAAHRNGVTNSQQEAQLNTIPPLVLSTSTDSPFSLQKVKANELRSFSNILGDGKATTTQVQQTNSLEKLEMTFKDEEPKELAWLKVGGRVTVGSSKSGTVRYIGPTHFSEGVWVGVELDTPSGKYDGSVEGHQYFQCNPGYGVLVRPDRLTRWEASKRHTENRRSGEFSQQLRGGAGTAIQKRENRKSWTS